METSLVRIFASLLLITRLVYGQSSWFSVNTPSGSDHWFVFFANPNTGYTNTHSTGQTWISTNGGLNWFIDPQNIGGLYSFVNSSTGFTAPILSQYSGAPVYKTTNGGFNWLLRGTLVKPYNSCLLFLNENTGFVSHFYNFLPWQMIYRTTNGGLNWSLSPTWYTGTPEDMASIHSMSFADASTGIAVGESWYVPKTGNLWIVSGFYVMTTNGGDDWQIVGSTGPHNMNSAKFVNPGTVFMGGDSLLRKSTNAGGNWTTLPFVPLCTKYCFVSDSICYAISGDNRIYKSRNGGYNWVVQLTTSSGISDIFFINERTGWVSTGDDILKTINGGDPYYSISGQIRFQDNNQPVNSGCVKALRYDRLSREIITIDSANIQSNGNYLLPHIPQDSLFIMAFEDDEARLLFVPTYYPSTTEWQQATVLFPTGNLSNIDILVYRINNTGGAYHIGGHIYSSSQMPLSSIRNAIIYAKLGNDYKGYSVSNSAGQYQVDSLSPGAFNIIVDRIGYNAASRTVVLTNYSKDTIDFNLAPLLTGVRKNIDAVPTNFWLGSNYPNPFNPKTKIEFGIPELANVRFAVFDILGREIVVLVNSKLNAGVYSVEWDGSNFASGVYFYQLQTAGYVQTRKLVLVK